MHPADHPLISERYFFPRPDRPASPRLVPVDGAALACAHVDHGHARTLLHFHGNGEVVADYQFEFPKILDALGLNTFLAEYRGYGGSTGTPQLAAMLDDVSLLVEAAGTPESLIVFGRSTGSIYAIEAARRFPNVAGLILESGISDVLERILLRATPRELGASEEELRQAFAASFDHRSKLSSYTGPLLILHAEHDHLVDLGHAHDNAEAAGGPCTLKVFPRGDHNSIFADNRDAYVAALQEFFASIGPPAREL